MGGCAAAALLLLLSGPLFRTISCGNEGQARSGLKSIRTAQEDFRVHDRDGNTRADYWRSDVAGLYAVVPPGGGEPIGLIERSIAGADAAPVTNMTALVRSPKAAYWYRALRLADEDPAKPDHERYAVCAYPNAPGSGAFVFILDHSGRIQRRAYRGLSDIPSVFPLDPVKEGWSTAE